MNDNETTTNKQHVTEIIGVDDKIIDFNFNHDILVKITYNGIRIREKYWKERWIVPMPALKTDKDWFSKIPLRDVMDVFWSSISYWGLLPLPIEMNFKIEVKPWDINDKIKYDINTESNIADTLNISPTA